MPPIDRSTWALVLAFLSLVAVSGVAALVGDELGKLVDRVDVMEAEAAATSEAVAECCAVTGLPC